LRLGLALDELGIWVN